MFRLTQYPRMTFFGAHKKIFYHDNMLANPRQVNILILLSKFYCSRGLYLSKPY